MDTVHITVEALAEDDPVERLVKFDRDLHQILFALNIQAGDLWHIWLGLWPRVVRFGWLDIGWCWVVRDSHGARVVGLLSWLWVVGLLGCLWGWLVCGLLRCRLVLLGLWLVSRLCGLRDICRLGWGWPWFVLGLWWGWSVLRFLGWLVHLLFRWLGPWLVLGWSLLWGWGSVLGLLWWRGSLLGWWWWPVLGLLRGRWSLLWRWAIAWLRSWSCGDDYRAWLDR